MHIQPHSQGAQLEEMGRSPLPVLKIEKSALILERKALTVLIFELNFLLKIEF